MSKIKGLSEIVDRMLKASKDFEQEVKEIVDGNVGDLELEAIRKAPGGGDMIATQYGSESQEAISRGRGWTPISQNIGSTISPDGLSGNVYVNESAGLISAWIEFGTGQSAKSYLMTVPKEWRELAQQYYINGRGSIIAQPYLLPSFFKQRIQFIKDLEKLVKDFKL